MFLYNLPCITPNNFKVTNVCGISSYKYVTITQHCLCYYHHYFQRKILFFGIIISSEVSFKSVCTNCLSDMILIFCPFFIFIVVYEKISYNVLQNVCFFNVLIQNASHVHFFRKMVLNNKVNHFLPKTRLVQLAPLKILPTLNTKVIAKKWPADLLSKKSRK